MQLPIGPCHPRQLNREIRKERQQKGDHKKAPHPPALGAGIRDVLFDARLAHSRATKESSRGSRRKNRSTRRTKMRKPPSSSCWNRNLLGFVLQQLQKN